MSNKSRAKAEQLLPRFVDSFTKLDYGVLDEAFDFEAWKVGRVPPGKTGCEFWAPTKHKTDPLRLEALYARLPARFPPLYESLILHYRWEEVDLELYTLLANPPGPDFGGLYSQISGDSALWRQLSRSGYLPFAKGPGGDYDRVCFDLKSRKKNRDCKIVKISHEEILCNNRIKVVSELASNFEDLVRKTIELADRV